MNTDEIRRIAMWATIASGAIAAILLYRRGVSTPRIARQVLTHPIGTFVNELHVPAPQPKQA